MILQIRVMNHTNLSLFIGQTIHLKKSVPGTITMTGSLLVNCYIDYIILAAMKVP